MATKTRNQAQIVTEVVRYANIMNDLIDVISFELRRQNPDDGKLFSDEEGIPYTVEQVKGFIKNNIQTANVYYWALDEFITKVGLNVVRDALLTWDIQATALKDDVELMKVEARYIWDNIDACNDWPDMIPLADRLDANIPKLTLIRRRWCL